MIPFRKGDIQLVHHRISFCGGCDCFMIICGKCGNNSCNGGSGEVNGKPCPDCDDAYCFQDKMWKRINQINYKR